MSGRRFVMVPTEALANPVFDDRVGRSTRVVYDELCRRAWTSKDGDTCPDMLAQGARGVCGLAFGGEKRIGETLRMGEQTVRGHLHRLLDAGLIVVWEPRHRAARLSTEYLVCHLATEDGLLAAKRRAEHRAAIVAAKPPHERRLPPTRDAHGRYRSQSPAQVPTIGRFRSSDRLVTGSPAVVNTAAEPSVNTAAGLPDQEMSAFKYFPG